MNNAKRKEQYILLDFVKKPLKRSLFLNKAVIEQDARCIESAHHASKLLNNRLVNRFLQMTKCA